MWMKMWKVLAMTPQLSGSDTPHINGDRVMGVKNTDAE